MKKINKLQNILDYFFCITFGFLSVLCLIILVLNRFTLFLLSATIGFLLLSLAYSPLFKKTLVYRLFLYTISLVIIIY